MSFLQYKESIEEGDTVIICRVSNVCVCTLSLPLSQGTERLVPIVVKKGEVTQVKGGAVMHDGLIGVKFGSKVLNHMSNEREAKITFMLQINQIWVWLIN